MTKEQQFSGIDISKKTFDVSTENEQGKLKGKKYAYTEEGMQAYIETLPSGVLCLHNEIKKGKTSYFPEERIQKKKSTEEKERNKITFRHK